MFKQRLYPDLFIYGSNTNDICQDDNEPTALFTKGKTLGNGLTPSMEMYNRLLKEVVKKK